MPATAGCPGVQASTRHSASFHQRPNLRPIALPSHHPKQDPKSPMTKGDAARIQAAEAKAGGGGVEKGGFAARAQAAGAKNAAAGGGAQQAKK